MQASKAGSKASQCATLDIALPCPHLGGQNQKPQSRTFSKTQHLLASLYKLLSILCIENSIETEGPTGVDFRVLLLRHSKSHHHTKEEVISRKGQHLQGPVIDLITLTQSSRPWSIIFSVEGEEGNQMVADFKNLSMWMAETGSIQVPHQFQEVPGGVGAVILESQPPVELEELDADHCRFQVVAVGGTFDHLHAGHKLLLTATALLIDPHEDGKSRPRRIIVGITGDELLRNKKYAEFLGSWDDRQHDVKEFLLSILNFSNPGSVQPVETYLNETGPNGHAVHIRLIPDLTIECVEISDPFGPTITDEAVDALVVSGETRSGGKDVNDGRKDKGWKTLEVFEIDVLDAEKESCGDCENAKAAGDFSSKISSTEARRRKNELSQRAKDRGKAIGVNL
jgi:phosphopantetheine adenylyltransferase